MKKKLGIIAQGDVLLIPYRGAIPTDAAVEPIDPFHGVVLAYGEATGSAHALAPGTAHVLAATATSPRLLVVDVVAKAEAILRHIKHPPHALPAKTVWEVRRQAEEIEGVAMRAAD